MKSQKNSKLRSIFRSIGASKERDYVVENLGTLIGAGVGMVEALRSIQEDIRSRRLKKIVLEIMTSVEEGAPVWRALDRSDLFDESIISLVRIGERSGRLSENLAVISEHSRKNRNFQSKIKSALLYPGFVLGITVFVGVGIAWFILPKLATVFGQLKLDLPIITRAIIKVGQVLGEYGQFIIPGFLVAAVVMIFFFFVYPKTKYLGQAFLFHIPGIGRMLQEVEIARFGYLLGTLIKAGLPINDAIESLAFATTLKSYRNFYTYLSDHIKNGYSIQNAFSSYEGSKKLIPSHVQQMVVTGEKSGSLSKMLIRASVMYEEKTENTAKNVAVLLEPFLLVIVWIGVMVVALGVILPIYGLLGGVR